MTSACVAFLPESDVVDGMQLGAARLPYRRGGGRQATDAARDLLQQLSTMTTTAAAPLFRASRCVHCRRCSRVCKKQGGTSGGNVREGKCPGGNVLHPWQYGPRPGVTYQANSAIASLQFLP